MDENRRISSLSVDVLKLAETMETIAKRQLVLAERVDDLIGAVNELYQAQRKASK